MVKKIFKDKAGNVLYEKKLKNGKIQMYAKNKQGRLVNEQGVKTMMHRAGYEYKKNQNQKNFSIYQYTNVKKQGE